MYCLHCLPKKKNECNKCNVKLEVTVQFGKHQDQLQHVVFFSSSNLILSSEQIWLHIG